MFTYKCLKVGTLEKGVTSQVFTRNKETIMV